MGPSPRPARPFRPALAGALCALATLLALSPCASAQVSEHRPSFAQREARTFDFEEIETSAPVPMYWVRAQDSPGAGRDRPGFPIWNAAELDATFVHAGKGAVKLPTRGGSTSLLLERGVLPVFQKADYVISAFVLTDGLNHARARIVARLLDPSGAVVPGSQRASELVQPRRVWSKVSVELPGDFENASFLQLELQLLQPQQFEAGTLGNRQVFSEDFDGAAWFDDVTISQLPRIEVSTASPANIVVFPARPDITFLVRDLTGEKLSVRLEILDADGNPVDRQSRSLTTGRTLAAWQPDLKKLGWYRGVLTVTNGAATLATTHVDFIWIPPTGAADAIGIRGELAGSAADWRRFELIALEPRPELCTSLPEILDRVGIGAVTVPVWEGLFEAEQPTATQERPSAALIGRLLDRGHQVTLSVPRLPTDLAQRAKVDPDDPWELARRGPELWAPFVDRYLDRFGQSVRRWQVGPAWDDRVFWDSGREKTLASVLRVFERLVPGPILCVPWRADLASTDQLLAQLPADAALRILVPEDMPAGAIDDVAAASRRAPPTIPATGARPASIAPHHDLSIVLGTDFGPRYGVRGSASELARRLVGFWKSFGDQPVTNVALLQPWEWSQDQNAQVMPKAELAVLANLIPRLSNRRFVGELPSAPGVRALVFSAPSDAHEPDRGMMVAWNESSPEPSVLLRTYLGATESRAYDIFGNRIAEGDPLDSAATFRLIDEGGSRATEALLRVTDEPVIVEGLDPRLALFQSRVRIDPELIQAGSKTHVHSIIVQNPWPTPVEVKVRVVKPGGVEGEESRRDRSWRVVPRQARVVVDPGKEERIPIELSYGPGEEAGPKEFVLDIEAATDQSMGTMRLHRQAELGSSTLDVQVSAKIDADQNVIVEAYVSNRGQGPMDLELTAFAPGLARSRSVVTNLMPGAVGMRAFRYNASAASLRGQRVYVTVEDVAGGLRLNKAVVIE